MKTHNYFFALFSALVLTNGSFSVTALHAEQAITASAPADFRGVAKKAIPAVVSIQVTRDNASPNSLFFGGSENDDPFGDDLWGQFFGFPSLKNRRNNTPQPSIGQASGFIFRPDGHVLTNNHVVKDVSTIQVILNDGREFDAKVIGQDPNTDLAILKVEATEPLPYLSLGNSDDLEVGQWVVAIGNPMGLQATLTAGVVSAKGRSNLDIAAMEDFIQTDTPINRGNSGGPLLDLDAHVVGINTAIVSNGSFGGYMGIGFSIPSNIVAHVVDQLLTTGKVTRGFLGINMQPINHNLAASFGLSKIEGALIAEVVPGSPAEKAGLKQGDVILKYNEKPVANITSFRNAVAMMTPGSTLNLTLLRDKQQITTSVNIGTFPTQGALLAKETSRLGIEVENSDNCVVIKSVDPNSAAALGGLKKGAIVVAVNQNKVQNVDEFYKQLETTEKGKPVLLLIKQGDSIRFLSLRVMGNRE